MSSGVRNITLTSYEDIFNTNISNGTPSNDGIEEIPLEKLYSFENHPFQVKDDEAMKELADSIREYGVLVPAANWIQLILFLRHAPLTDVLYFFLLLRGIGVIE